MAGCSHPHLDTKVSVFHKLNGHSADDKTLAIIAVPEDRNASLDFATYRQFLAKDFDLAGFNIVDRADQADYIAFVSYGIDSGLVRTAVVAVPPSALGQVNGASTGFANYGGGAYRMPIYDLSVGSSSGQLRAHNLSVDILDRNSLERGASNKVWEGRATVQSNCPTMAGVMDSMSHALLDDFPGTSGASRVIEVDWNGGC
jgi:hypothetical protein